MENTNAVSVDEAIRRFLVLPEPKLLGICISMHYSVYGSDYECLLTYNSEQLVSWITETHNWNVNTQRWECRYGHILCKQQLAQEKEAA